MTAISLSEARRLAETVFLEKAASDTDFRALLVRDPHAALVEAFGSDPVADMRLRVVEEGAGEVILVLPQALNQDELPDSLLDLAAGGINNKMCQGDRSTIQEREYLGYGQGS